MPPALHFFLHLSLQCILWSKVFLVWKLYWSGSVFEMIICSTRFLSAKFGHNDYIILTFKAEFVCPACSDFITSSYLNAPEALKLHTNGFSLQTSAPDLTPVLMPYSTHLDQNHFLMMEIVTWNIPLSNGKTENSLLGVWFWGSVSHFRSRPFVTGSYLISITVSVLDFYNLPVSWAFLLATHPAHCFHQCQFIVCVPSLKVMSINK